MINKYLLAGDKFMPEMHLRQPRCTHSACGSSFTKTKKRIQNLKKQEIQQILTKTNKMKLAFNINYLWRFLRLGKRTTSDKALRDNPFNIAKNLKHDGYQHGLASVAYKFFDKKVFRWCC